MESEHPTLSPRTRRILRPAWRGALVVLGLLGAASVTSAAHAEPSAEDRETARTLMIRGDQALDEGRPADALEAFEAARAIVDIPTTALAVAKAQAQVGRLVEARNLALEVTRTKPEPDEPPPFAGARVEAGELAHAIAARIATLEITVSGTDLPSDLEISIDGKPLSAQPFPMIRRLDPGEHEIRVTAAGFEPSVQSVRVEEGATLPVTLPLGRAVASPGPFADDAAPADEDQGGLSPLVFVGFGIGAAGLIVGGVTGAMSLSRKGDADAYCEGNRCTPEAQDDIDASQSLATVSNIGFVVGAVGVVMGTVGFVLSGSDSSEASVSLSGGPGSLWLKGKF